MSVDDELTRIERWYVRVAGQVAAGPRLLHALLPGLMLTTAGFDLWMAHGNLARDPRDAFWTAAVAGLLGGGALVFLADYRLLRALGVVSRRLAETTAPVEPSGPLAREPRVGPRPRPARFDPGPLRAACLVAFASGLAVCGVALWRFGIGDAAPAWAGVAMGSAGGLGAGASLVASFVPRWIDRVARLEARVDGAAP